jgi:hypothetical protein
MRSLALACRSIGDRDGDLVGSQQRIEGHVVVIAQHQLQRVLAGLERDRGFGLALAEMHQLIGGQRCGQVGRQLAVDQQVVVTGGAHRHAGRRDAHALETEQHGDLRAFDGGAIGGADDIDRSAGRSRRARQRLGDDDGCGHGKRSDGQQQGLA